MKGVVKVWAVGFSLLRLLSLRMPLLTELELVAIDLETLATKRIECRLW